MLLKIHVNTMCKVSLLFNLTPTGLAFLFCLCVTERRKCILNHQILPENIVLLLLKTLFTDPEDVMLTL